MQSKGEGAIPTPPHVQGIKFFAHIARNLCHGVWVSRPIFSCRFIALHGMMAVENALHGRCQAAGCSRQEAQIRARATAKTTTNYNRIDN